MYVNSGGAGAGDCEGAAAEEEHCANDQPVSALLRASLEHLLVEHQVGMFGMFYWLFCGRGWAVAWLVIGWLLVGDCFDWLLVSNMIFVLPGATWAVVPNNKERIQNE